MNEEQSYVEEYVKVLRGRKSALMETQRHHIEQVELLGKQIIGLQEVIGRLEHD